MPVEVLEVLHEIIDRVGQKDPVCGGWTVSTEGVGRVWCDASNVAVAVCVEVDGRIVEDASWLRKKGDASHINTAELEAVVKGVNLAIKWGLRKIEILTDSVTVKSWVSSVVNDSHRPRVSGLSEMVNRRRLSVVSDLIREYGLELSISYVPSQENLADVLTRVPKTWLCIQSGIDGIGSDCAQEVASSSHDGVCTVGALMGAAGSAASAGPPHAVNCGDGVDSDAHFGICDVVRDIHEIHHLGVDRTLYFARRKLGSGLSRSVVADVVSSCAKCQSIDTSSASWEHGSLEVKEHWWHLAVDIVHVHSNVYLSVIDCGPSRFMVWRKLADESASSVVAQLRGIFREHGPPAEMLSDNGPCFRAAVTRELLGRWGVVPRYSCAYQPSGNGIAERSHRTIKRMVARSGRPVEDMVFWFNNSPSDAGVAPASVHFGHTVRLPGLDDSVVGEDAVNCPYKIGDEVYVKPPAARCMTAWDLKTVSGIVSDVAVLVDGVPRHIRDVRPRGVGNVSSDPASTTVDEVVADGIGNQVEDGALVRSQRDRRPPLWMRDFGL